MASTYMVAAIARQPMIFPPYRFSTATVVLSGLLLLAVGGCRQTKKSERISIDHLKVTMAPELGENQLGGLNGEVYGQFAASPIHWQSWGPDVLTRAKDSKRLLFCVIAISQQPGFQNVMRELENNADIVEAINANYVPVMVDADQAREFLLLSRVLSEEISRSLAFPVLLWMDYQGNPVACTPVSDDLPGGVTQVFDQSHAMIGPMWKEDLEVWMAKGDLGYVLGNSAHDQSNRQKRMLDVIKGWEYCEDLRQDVPTAVRQLLSQFDTDTQNFSQAGGRIPVRAIRLLCAAVADGTMPEGVSSRSKEVLQGLMDELLPSAMFDPLDGGAFISRAAASWELPNFIKDGASQADLVGAMFETYLITGDRKVLDRARLLMAHLEADHRTADGLFILAPNHDTDPQRWMWSEQEIADLLGSEDAVWWQQMTGMKSLGNLPLDVDPTRQLFRKNSLGMKQSLAALAKRLSLDEAAAARRFEQIRTKLLAARNARMREDPTVKAAHLETSLRMVSAYVSAQRATGDAAYAEQAKALLGKIRSQFVRDGVLHLSPSAMPDVLSRARAGHYALAAIAALDVASLGQGDACLTWAGELLDRVSSTFVRDGVLHEAPPVARLFHLPLESRKSLLGDSTVGLLSIAAARLELAGRPLAEDLKKLVSVVPVSARQEPFDHVGVLHGGLIRNRIPTTTR